MLRVMFLAGVFLLASASALPPTGDVQAQESIDSIAACQQQPHSEECICANVRQFSKYPLDMDDLDHNDDGIPAVWDDFLGQWTGDDIDLSTEYVKNFRYTEECAYSYFRENLRRIWYFTVFLGAVLAAVSFTWAGFVYMQDSSSGQDLSRARNMLMRVLIGLLILAFAFLVWETINNLVFPNLQSWTLERNSFFYFD